MTCPAGYSFDNRRRKEPFAAITETLEPGQRFQFWDFDILWTELHLPASRLEPLRKIGDPLADNALEVLKIKPGDDALKALRAYLSLPEEEQESPAPRLLMQQLMTVPEWVDWEQIQRGQEVFWRYSLYIVHILLHFSLAGGFAIPKITKVLNSTGYLSGTHTKQRVYETSQFVHDVVHSIDYLQPGTGVAWESIVQVRFLHAGVRARLSKISRAHSKYYNIEEHGVPINQEDLLGTMFSFSNTVWRVMEVKLDVFMTSQEREDYLHLWRYVGYMIGVDDILGAGRTPERADACLESIVLHLSDPDEESGQLCKILLKSVASKPIIPATITNVISFPDPFKVHLALSEQLLGPVFWKTSGLPHISIFYRVFKQMVLNFMFFDLWLAKKYPKWFRIRRLLLSRAQTKMITNNFGKRTKFELKVEPKAGGRTVDDPPAEGLLKKADSANEKYWPRMLTAASAAMGLALVLGQREW
ncbi:hypothetical protein FBU30_010092 [Linnemannia zychae]|nr:hypothetical protein FBU30_010092 [Linnemannia zychae]